MARRNERKQAAMARDSDDDDEDMGSRNRKRSNGGDEIFDGLMSDPSKRRKGKTAFDRSQRNIGRSKSNNKGKGRK